jgi:anti-sigma factor RsiW
VISCRELSDLFLDAWVEGELPARRERDCRRHVARCTACAHHVRAYRATIRLVREDAPAVDASDLPEELVRSILRAAG